MRTKKADYESRKDIILGIVVNEYIKTVSPVSSGLIAQDYPLDVSPATVRNILAELEEEGYLTHPHTSAGRMPTQMGYRYYVDNLMNEIKLLEGEQARIKTEYDQGRKDLEKVLEKTSQMVSDITHYTSIISVDGIPDKVFLHGTSYVVGYPDMQDIQKIREILSTLEEKERLLSVINRHLQKRIQIYIGHEMACSNIGECCSLAVSQYRLPAGTSGRIAVLGPTHMDYQRVVSTLDYLTEYLNRAL
ncbi:MAG: hypothetical protein Q8Q08_05755 [Candidatus Omnitrophota bacterium]|nr:hypothetical protein [Candidatus Omnitrophota bacterium]MDZ4241796.1 hypothetical protein [Candidatus Omnitrophota bacterium]